MNTTERILIAAALVAALASCKKDDPVEPTPTPTPTTASVRLAFEFLNGANDFDLTDAIPDSTGRLVRFDNVRFYVSNTELADMNDSVVASYDDVYMLVDASHATNEFALGTVAPMHIHDVDFLVGLDSLTNHQDPTTAAAPLNDATMHWNWLPSAGYKFIVLEGRVDNNNDGVVDNTDDAFIYHIASDALLGAKSLAFHQDVTAGATNTFFCHVDMAAFASQIDIGANLDTHSMMATLPLAFRVRDAFLGAMTAH